MESFTYERDVAYLRLSDAYETKQEEPELELKVAVYNINAGHNQELMEQCKILAEYAAYVARVRQYAAELPLNEAVEKAVTECIRENILAEFLSKNRAEVIKVSIFEYDKEKEEKKLRKAEYEAGRQEGLQEGRQVGRQEGLQEGRQAGHQEGRKEGFMQGVQGIIRMGRKCNLSDQEIIRELQESLACDEADAAEYLKMQ